MKNKFYCQNICGDVDFSIDEWNKVYNDIKDLDLPEKEENLILFGSGEQCNEQCFNCMAIVGSVRENNKNLTGKAEDSPAREAYLNWKIKNTARTK